MFGFDRSGIWGITKRDLIKYFRNKNQIITTLLMPTIFMTFMRQGFSAVAQNPFINFSNYIGAGVFCMALIMAGLFMAGAPILFDKMMGFSDVITVAPVEHKNIVFGFVFAGTLKSMFQASIIVVIAGLTDLLPIDHSLGVLGIILSFFPLFLIIFFGAMAYASIGICIAARTDMTNTFLWVTIIQIPLVFISGAMFPITGFPEFIRPIAILNPTTFLADGIRTFLGGEVGHASTSNLFGDNFLRRLDKRFIGVLTGGHILYLEDILAFILDFLVVLCFWSMMLILAFRIYGRSLKESTGGFIGIMSKRMEKERKKMLKGLDPESRDAMNLLWNKFGSADMPKIFMTMAEGKKSEIEKMFTERGITKEETDKIFDAMAKMMEKMAGSKKK